MTNKNKINTKKEIQTRKPDFESVSQGLRGYVNTTKDKTRTYLVILDNEGQKFYLNKVDKKEVKK